MPRLAPPGHLSDPQENCHFFPGIPSCCGNEILQFATQNAESGEMQWPDVTSPPAFG